MKILLRMPSMQSRMRGPLWPHAKAFTARAYTLSWLNSSLLDKSLPRRKNGESCSLDYAGPLVFVPLPIDFHALDFGLHMIENLEQRRFSFSRRRNVECYIS